MSIHLSSQYLIRDFRMICGGPYFIPMHPGGTQRTNPTHRKKDILSLLPIEIVVAAESPEKLEKLLILWEKMKIIVDNYRGLC